MLKTLTTSAVALCTLTGAVCHAATTVSEFHPLPVTPVQDEWYLNDIRFGGSATIESLVGQGGNLESAQPLPTGAAHLTTTSDNNDKAEVATYGDFGLASSVLSDVDLQFSYFKGTSPEVSAAPALKLIISSATGTGDNFGSLVYEPYWNGAVNQNQWTQVTIDENTGSGGDSTGGWWWSGGFEIGNSAGGPPLRSLSEWATAFTGADGDFADAHVIGIAVGVGTYNPNQDDYFDAVSFKTASIDKTYDFEAASVPDQGGTFALLAMSLAGTIGVFRRQQRNQG